MKRLSAVLREWLKNVTDGSWSNIVYALKEMEENVLAREIDMKYCRPAQGLSQTLSCEPQQKWSEEAIALVYTNKLTLKDRFAQLQTVVYQQIQKRLNAGEINIRDFLVYMTTLFPPKKCIPETTDVSEIFKSITHHRLWDYLNYEPLERVARMYGGKEPDLTALLEAYVQDLNGFKVVTKMADYLSDATATSSSGSEEEDETSPPLARKDRQFRRKLQVKLKIPISAQSLSYVDEVWNSLAKRFLLPSSSAILDKIIEGSLYITWLIPAFFLVQMMEMAEQPEVIEFFQDMKAELVTVDGVCLYQEQKEQEDSSDSSFDEDQEPPPEPEGLAITADSFQEEMVADQHHDSVIEQSSSVCGVEENQFDEKKLSPKDDELAIAADSFQEEEVDMATNIELPEIIQEESAVDFAEVSAVKSVDGEPSSHPHSHAESYPHPSLHLPHDQPQVTGFDVELVKESTDLRCPICLLVLRDPMQVNCCGKRFCQLCIDNIRAEAKPCPACKCKAGEYDIFEDKGQKQAILEVKIHCSNRKLGCGWTGELCQLDKHLNLDPKKGRKLDIGCQYAKLKCIHCYKDYPRSHMCSCPQQSYTCPYCQCYSSTYEDIHSHHFSVCEEFPFQCKMCSMKIPQKSLQQHLLECDKNKNPRCQSTAIPLKITSVLTPSPVFVPPPNFIMAEFTSLKECNMPWFSSPFYSHIGGYKMCLAVLANGYDSMVGTHVAVFVHLMCGEYDSTLTWPFRGHITIQLVNQRKDEGYVEDTVSFDDNTPDNSAGQVTEGEIAVGLGSQSGFISHSALHYDKFWNTEYLKSDCLEFRIFQVKLREIVDGLPVEAHEHLSRDTEQPELPSIPPVDIVMNNFISYKKRGIGWYSQPFYSHTGGYKMCLCVYANGVMNYVGTHMSVYVCLMCGENDDNLTWPFRGHITVQLVNQRKDEGHVEVTITFDDSTPDIAAGQMTGDNKPPGWGLTNFIPHSALQYDELLNTEYLKKDYLEFQISHAQTVDKFPVKTHYQPSRDTEQPELPPIPPVNIVMSNFVYYKKRGIDWYSQPFYSHTGGYKMCLRIFADGDKTCVGTHVSVFLCLMCGENDDNLTWPFRGNIKIQLVNQKKDEGHVEDTITFNDSIPDIYAGRVAENEKTPGWGIFSFIPHSALHYDELLSIEHLKKDCLQFRIIQVDFSQ